MNGPAAPLKPPMYEEIEVIERDVIRLHPAHRKAGHGPVIAIRDLS